MANGKFLVEPEANWQPADWASAEVRAVLDVYGSAELKRGINLGIGGEVGVGISGSIANYIAVDAGAEAHGAIELKGQAQILLDLFDEVGVAIRLRAVAELGASVKLGIGISIQEFKEQAKKIDLINDNSILIELLDALLDEVGLEAGVSAKASLAAMAYANLSITGRLTKKGDDGPGFYLVGDFGAGLEAGAGYQMFAKAGIKKSSRLIRKTVDIAVDHTIATLEPFIKDADVANAEANLGLLHQLRAPTKMAMRIAFETGMKLTIPGLDRISKETAKEIALRCVQVAVEEAQPFIIELLLDWAISRIRKELGLDETAWDKLLADSESIASLLIDGRPTNPFSAAESDIEVNLAYWNKVVAGLDSLAKTIADIEDAEAKAAPYLAIAWCAIQLLFIVSRYSISSSEEEKDTPPLEVRTKIKPPQVVLNVVSEFLGKPSLASINFDDLVSFARRKVIECVDDFIPKDSSQEVMLRILVGGGEQSAFEKVLEQLISSCGSMYSSSDADQLITLDTVKTGLNWYLKTKVEPQLIPVVKKSKCDETTKTILAEVLVPAISTTTDSVITALLNYAYGNKTAIREACSSVIMRLLSRSLVVITDILLATTMKKVGDGLLDFDYNLDKTVQKLTQDSQYSNLANVLHDTVTIAAKVYDETGKIYTEIRPEIRQLLYTLIDGNLKFPVKEDAVPHLAELTKLAVHVVTMLEKNVEGFARELLLNLAKHLYEKFEEIIAEVGQQLESWKNSLEKAESTFTERVTNLGKEIEHLAAEAKKQVDLQINQTKLMLKFASTHPKVFENKLKEAMFNEAKKISTGTVFLKAAKEVIEHSGVKLIANTFSDACTTFIKDMKKINSFLSVAHKFNNKKQSKDVAQCLGEHLGVVIAGKLQIHIGIKGIKQKTLGVPASAVKSVCKTAAGSMAELVKLADPMIEFFIKQTDFSADHKKKTIRHKAANDYADTTRALHELKPAADASITVLSPVENEFVSRDIQDISIKIQFKKIPSEFLAKQALQQPRILVWLNHKLIDLQSAVLETANDNFTLSFSPELRGGPNVITVKIVDFNLTCSSGFFMALGEGEAGKEHSVSDSDIQIAVDSAKNQMQVKSKTVLDEIDALVSADVPVSVTAQQHEKKGVAV